MQVQLAAMQATRQAKVLGNSAFDLFDSNFHASLKWFFRAIHFRRTRLSIHLDEIESVFMVQLLLSLTVQSSSQRLG